MIILPAIDIKNGQCVRLYQGDYDRVTTYAADPVQVAQRWQGAGASWLHVVDLDGRNGWVATSGWRETSSTQALSLAAELRLLGVRRFIYTDIARDGALGGPNLEALAEMKKVTPEIGVMSHGRRQPSCSLIASGGVSSIADLRAIAALDIEGAIVGRAIYTGDVDLSSAIQQLERGGS